MKHIISILAIFFTMIVTAKPISNEKLIETTISDVGNNDHISIMPSVQKYSPKKHSDNRKGLNTYQVDKCRYITGVEKVGFNKYKSIDFGTFRKANHKTFKTYYSIYKENRKQDRGGMQNGRIQGVATLTERSDIPLQKLNRAQRRNHRYHSKIYTKIGKGAGVDWRGINRCNNHFNTASIY